MLKHNQYKGHRMQKNNTLRAHGFTVIEAIIIIVVIAILLLVGYKVMNNNKDDSKDTAANNSQQTTKEDTSAQSKVRWENTGEGGWIALDGTPPACPNPFQLVTPADLTKATALLYPGQERHGAIFAGAGGNYKPHGGFRFDDSKNSDVMVKSPISGYVYRGSQYLLDGEIQYTFDIVHPCGMMVRVGHLRALSETFQAYANAFPAAAEGDSRTERIQGFPAVKAGDPIATSVGITADSNVFFDLGVYDLRKKNAVSQTVTYQQAHADNKELAWHAVCWFDMLPTSDEKKIKSLPPGDPISGKNSDYCD